MTKLTKFFILLFILFLNTSCITKSLSQKGYVFDDNDISNINVGLTNKENTLRYLGYPLNKSYFNSNLWFYYSYKIKEVLFFKPKIMDQKVLVIEFDNETDIVKSKTLYEIDSNKYKILNAEGDYNKDTQNIIKDILNNIGQVSM